MYCNLIQRYDQIMSFEGKIEKKENSLWREGWDITIRTVNISFMVVGACTVNFV